ncbi:MAG: dihydropteroate synthase, partial [Verrucomicrobiota bacterium]
EEFQFDFLHGDATFNDMLSLETLASLATRYAEDLNSPVRSFEIQGISFPDASSPALMGVINLSRDSWYRESVVLTAEAAIRRGKTLQTQGASILDIGAESSLAHAKRVDAIQQKSLLFPVVKELSRLGSVISVETYHPEVTKAMLEAGARIINLTGTVQTEEIFKQVAEFDAGVILCFVQGENV